MDIEKLYAQFGQLTVQKEILDAQLLQIKQAIVNAINSGQQLPPPPPPKEENKKAIKEGNKISSPANGEKPKKSEK